MLRREFFKLLGGLPFLGFLKNEPTVVQKQDTTHSYVSCDCHGFHLFANRQDNKNEIGICGCNTSKSRIPNDSTIVLSTGDTCQELIASKDSVFWIGNRECWRLDYQYTEKQPFIVSFVSDNGPFYARQT